MGKVTNSAVEARRRAKARRVKLHEDRAERDRRIEQAAADFFVAQGDKAAALAAAEAADLVLAARLHALLSDEGLSQTEAATLLDVEAAEIRRLAKMTPGTGAAGERDGSRPATREDSSEAADRESAGDEQVARA